MNKIVTYINAHKIISAIIGIVVLAGSYYGYKATHPAPVQVRYVLGTIQRRTIVSSVTGTGQITTLNKVDLKPQGSSQSAETISHVAVKQGDIVKVGQLIAVVDNKSAIVSLNQAKASVESAQANYNKVVAGATSQDINVSQTAVQTARQSLVTKISSDYTLTENTIRTNTDQLYSNPTSYSPQFGITFFDSTTNQAVILGLDDINLKLQLSSERSHINDVLTAWRTALTVPSTSDVDSLVKISIDSLNQIKNYLIDVGTGVNSIYLSQTKYAATVNAYKTNVATARTAIDSYLSDIISGQQAIVTAQSQLDFKQAPSRPQDVQTAKAQLDSALASLQSAQDTYQNSFIRAPFGGEIAQVNIVVGDQADTATVIATLVTQQRIALISLNEVDVAKIKLGDKASLTFDALPNLSITGTVAQIDTLGTVSQGVVTYNVKIIPDTNETTIKPGMSVTAAIITDTKPNVLVVPTTAVKSTPRGKYVETFSGVSGVSADISSSTRRITTSIKPIQQPVEIGITNDTQTEITSGLNEGDTIVFKTETGIGSKTTTSAPSLFGGSSGGARGLGR